MGFNVVTLAQKPRTRTLIVDSDLDMGNYDLIATDVKGDTAEFSEFVGGVGNFESGLISGGLDVSGILHAESNLQVDGGISLEGSINNVNITSDGHINAPLVQTPILKLPTSTTGNFKIGTISMNAPSVWQSQTSTGTDLRYYSFNAAPQLTSTIPEVFYYDISSIGKTVSYSMFAVNVGVEYKFYQNDELLHSTTSRTGTFDLLYYDVPVTFTMQATGQSGTISGSSASLSRGAIDIYLV